MSGGTSKHTLDQLDSSNAESSELRLPSRQLEVKTTGELADDDSLVTEIFSVRNIAYARFVVNGGFHAACEHRDLKPVVNPTLMKCVVLHSEILKDYVVKLVSMLQGDEKVINTLTKYVLVRARESPELINLSSEFLYKLRDFNPMFRDSFEKIIREMLKFNDEAIILSKSLK